MNRARALLSEYGFDQAQIGAVSHHQGDVIFSDIKLDPEGFSSISLLRARPQWGEFFSGSGFFDDIAIDRLVLTIDMTESLPDATAMAKTFASLMGIDADNIRINAINIDMNTPKGVIALMAKAAITRQENDVRRLDGALWGSQFQLGLDTRWDATVTDQDEWKAAAEIKEIRFSLGALTLSRGNGWFSVEDAERSTPTLEGQIAAGQFRIGQETVLGNMNLTVDGAAGQEHITLTGITGTKQDIALTVDLSKHDGQFMLRAEAQTKKAENLLLFLSQINHDLQSSVLNAPGLTNLLITQGNINRIRQQLKKSSYDSYTLAISGTWEKLNGKILAQKASKKGGTPRTDVISLNPAN